MHAHKSCRMMLPGVQQAVHACGTHVSCLTTSRLLTAKWEVKKKDRMQKHMQRGESVSNKSAVTTYS